MGTTLKKVGIFAAVVVVILLGLLAYFYFTNNTMKFSDVVKDVDKIASIGFMVDEEKAVMLSSEKNVKEFYDKLKDVEFQKYFGNKIGVDEIGNPMIIVRHKDEYKVLDVNIYAQNNRFPQALLKSNMPFVDYYRVSDLEGLEDIIEHYNKLYKENHYVEEEKESYTGLSSKTLIQMLEEEDIGFVDHIYTTSSPMSVDLQKLILSEGGGIIVFEYDDESVQQSDLAKINSDGSIVGTEHKYLHYFVSGGVVVAYDGEVEGVLGALRGIMGAEYIEAN